MSTTPPPAEPRTHDGLRLRLRHWPAAAARGTVLVVHGLGEHIGGYEHVAAHMNGWGWAVLGYDQRGHGRGEGARGRLPDGADLLRGLALLVDSARAAGGGPLVLLGHSMGGLVVARFAAGTAGGVGAAEPWSREVDALALSSPALDPGMNAWQKLLLAVLGALAPDLAVNNGLKPEWISRDARVVRASSSMAAHEFRPLFHEIFNEPERGEVFAWLRDWLAPLGAPTTAQELSA